jgi:hypothetical protein
MRSGFSRFGFSREEFEMKKMLPLLLAAAFHLSACSPAAAPPDALLGRVSPTDTFTPLPPADTPTAAPPAETGTPFSIMQPLVISFNPNPVAPFQGDPEGWIWEFTFDVFNPNGFTVPVVAFGDFDQCLENIDACGYTGEDFKEWFDDCGKGSDAIPAKGHACDGQWRVRSLMVPLSDRSGRYALYVLDGTGQTQVFLSELLVLQKP